MWPVLVEFRSASSESSWRINKKIEEDQEQKEEEGERIIIIY